MFPSQPEPQRYHFLAHTSTRYTSAQSYGTQAPLRHHLLQAVRHELLEDTARVNAGLLQPVLVVEHDVELRLQPKVPAARDRGERLEPVLDQMRAADGGRPLCAGKGGLPLSVPLHRFGGDDGRSASRVTSGQYKGNRFIKKTLII